MRVRRPRLSPQVGSPRASNCLFCYTHRYMLIITAMLLKNHDLLPFALTCKHFRELQVASKRKLKTIVRRHSDYNAQCSATMVGKAPRAWLSTSFSIAPASKSPPFLCSSRAWIPRVMKRESMPNSIAPLMSCSRESPTATIPSFRETPNFCLTISYMIGSG